MKLLNSVLLSLFLIAAFLLGMQSQKPSPATSGRLLSEELKVCGIWHDHLLYQLDLLTEQDTRLKTENSALRDRIRLYEDVPSESEP